MAKEGVREAGGNGEVERGGMGNGSAWGKGKVDMEEESRNERGGWRVKLWKRR